jgi:hypothetical protein
MTVYPRYVPTGTGTGKWNDNDINAVVVAILTGRTTTGYFANPYTYMIRAIAGVYDAIDSTGNVVYGGIGNVGLIDGHDLKAVLQATINAARGTVNHALTGDAARIDVHATIAFSGDMTLAAGGIDLADINDLRLICTDGTFTVQTNDPVVFDCTNSQWVRFENFWWIIPATYHPDCLFLLARDISGASSSPIFFRHCIFDDHLSAGCDAALLYNFASESTLIESCWFYHVKHAIVFTSNNIFNLTSTFKTIDDGTVPPGYSCNGLTLDNAAFTKAYWETVFPYYQVYMDCCRDIVVGNMSYFGNGINEPNYAFFADMTNGYITNLVVSDSIIEGKVITTNAVVAANSNMMGAKFTNNYIKKEPGDTYKVVDLNRAGMWCYRWNWKGNDFHNNAETYEFELPEISECELDFRDSQCDPTVVIAEFWTSNLIMGSSAKCTVTSFATGKITFLDTGGGTQSKGHSTGTGAQQTIAHGLIYEPDWDDVFLSERSSGGALAYQSAEPDATNIYVTATDEKDYNWRVSKDSE